MASKRWLWVEWPPWTDVDAERNRGKVEARQSLMNYCVEASNFLQAGHHPDQFKDSEKVNIQKAVQYTLAWLDMNQHAGRDDFEAQQEVLEDVVNPVKLRIDGLSVELPSDSE